MNGLLVEGLSAGYHGVPAVRDLDLEVRPGEVVALLGPNGAGKTTTLMALAGQVEVHAGTVRFGGRRWREPLFRRARGGLGLLLEGRSVFMELTGQENLRLGRGDPADALRYFPELEEVLRVKAGLMSGGQQQMLALARVLAAGPKLILADELSLGLAPLVVRRLLRAVREAARDGAAVLLVEQHVRVALEHVDRAYVLSRGRPAMSGTAAELRADLGVLEGLYLSDR